MGMYPSKVLTGSEAGTEYGGPIRRNGDWGPPAPPVVVPRHRVSQRFAGDPRESGRPLSHVTGADPEDARRAKILASLASCGVHIDPNAGLDVSTLESIAAAVGCDLNLGRVMQEAMASQAQAAVQQFAAAPAGAPGAGLTGARRRELLKASPLGRGILADEERARRRKMTG